MPRKRVREEQVWKLLGLGRTRAQIMQEMGIGEKAYEAHIANLSDRYRAATAMELRRLAALESAQSEDREGEA